MVETRQRFDEEISALIAKLIAAGREEVKRLIELERVMPAKMNKTLLEPI